MTIPNFGKLKLFCIAVTLALGACGGGSDSSLPAPAPVVVVPPVPDNKSVLTLQLLDTRSQTEGAGSLRDNPYDSFSFLLNGKPIVVTSRDIDNAKTFADLRSAIDSAINAQKPTNPALANLALTLGSNYAVFGPVSGVPVVGQSILLTNTGDGIIRRNLASGWFTTGEVAVPGSIYSNIIEGSPAPQAPVPEDVASPVPDNRSVLTLRLMDTGSQAEGTGPLRDNQFDGFSFLLDRKPIVVRSPAIYSAKTFADLRAAIEGAINTLKPSTPALAEFVVTLGANYTVFDTRSGLPVVGQSILLTDQSGGIITLSPFAGWLTVAGLVTPGTIYNAMIEGIPAPPTPVLGVVAPAALDKRSVLRLELLDTRSQAAGTGPLRDNPYDGFSFLLNGTPIVVRSPAINAAKTFANLRSAIDSAINALKPTNSALANLAVTRGPTYARFDPSSGLPVVGQSILLTDLSGGIITVNPTGGWSTPSGLIPADFMYRSMIDSNTFPTPVAIPAPPPVADPGVLPGGKASVDPTDLLLMVARAQRNGAAAVQIVIRPTPITELGKPDISPAFVQRKNLLLAELGREAWEGGRLDMDGIGVIMLHVTEAGLDILQNSTNAVSFRPDSPWRYTKLNDSDGSLDEIDRLLDSQGYVDAVVNLNLDGLEFDILKDGSISFRTTTQTIADSRAIARVVINRMTERQLPARSAIFAAIDTMMAPTLTLRLTREGVLKLILDDWIRTLKPVGFLGAQPLGFGTNMLEEAQRAGSAEVVIFIRTPMLHNFLSRISLTSQTEAHRRAIYGVLEAAGPRDTTLDTLLFRAGAMVVKLTYAQLLAIKNSKDARLLAVELNRPAGTPF